MKVNAGDLNKNSFINHNGEIFRVLKMEHNYRGRGSASIKTRIRNVVTQNTLDITLKPDNKVEQIDVDSIQMQYAYPSGSAFAFMNEQTYEQIEVPEEVVGDFAKYMKEGEKVYVIMHEGKPLAIRPPASVRLEVTEAQDAAKGDTATNAKKPVIVETGAEVMVPIFIKKGEVIVINPETGDYIERSN